MDLFAAHASIYFLVSRHAQREQFPFKTKRSKKIKREKCFLYHILAFEQFNTTLMDILDTANVKNNLLPRNISSGKMQYVSSAIK